ncbi:flavin-containing monooxygenase [Halomonas korlensis]|uniref:Cyclohexanone monooxygenase n=1 Tax=Halomonas korlensis TaxID=463301 RepID=A0A1I7IIZ8_9GAMM|nr:NAD(P)/FAD-dependent oxidoreductase [Halomonas korlensis]SFU72890.1 cyclohexanone monooxygenase [Halomonas korlensis]
MDDFASILPLTAPLDRDGLRRLAIHACLELHRVRWRRGYLAADGQRLLCWYQARDAESVRLVLRQQGAAAAAVWPVMLMGGMAREVLEGTSDRVLVELPLDGCDPSDPTATASALLDALVTAGAVVTRAFLSRPRGRLICLVKGRDIHAVTLCLGTAGLVPTSVWRCTELDPQPPRLFESQSAPRPPDLGRKTQVVRRPAPHPKTAALDAVIIGAGLSGICALERLSRMGLRARVYESGTDVGGVWHWNRYPGARVDSEIHTYGFSFSDALLREWEWQELFPAQPEISRYLCHVVDRFGLRRHIRLGTSMLAATFDEGDALWDVETSTGERVAARYLIAATGTLSVPQLPDYPGMRDFSGESFYTARWPAGVALDGKRVGIIGTGASGVQMIQTIAPEVAHLTVFQRTPTYCIPQRNRPLTDADRREIRRDWAQILATCHESYGGFIHTFDPRSGLAVSAAEREAKFEHLWQKAGFAFWFGNFADLMMSFEVNDHACDFLRRKIQARVHDPETARRLMPSHPFGTKRVPLENGYYEMFNRGNVVLEDLRETPIERVTSGGIRTSRKEYPLDVIVYATGFDAGTGSLSRIDIRGTHGLSLAQKWKEGPKTFLGLLVSGFPNLFIVNGPHNAAALCNAGRCIEQNVDWIVRCIEHMRRQGAARIVPTPAAEDEWTGHVYDVAEASVLATMKDSWFFGANTPGKPRVATIYAAGAREYRKHCETVANAGFAGLELS